MAYESPMITADMVEATEFPHLVVRYNVAGVPTTVINETERIEGMMPEQALLQRISEYVKQP